MNIEWARLFMETLLSWPVAILVLAIAFRGPVSRLIPTLTKAKIGPIELERAVEKVENVAARNEILSNHIAELQVLSAQTRIDEIEIWLGSFGAMLSEDRNANMREAIEKMKRVMSEVDQMRDEKLSVASQTKAEG